MSKFTVHGTDIARGRVNKYKAGQKLWFVAQAYHRGPKPDGKEVEIRSVGTKYLILDLPGRRPVRVDRVTLRIHDGYYPGGQCYLSREEHEAKEEALRAFVQFYKAVDLMRHKGWPPAERTKAAAAALGIILEDY